MSTLVNNHRGGSTSTITLPKSASPPAPWAALPVVLTDELGKLVLEAHRAYLQSSCFEDFVRTMRKPSDLSPNIPSLEHPAAPLLESYCDGVPVRMSTPPWTMSRREEALARGAHRSATEFQDFLRQEFVEFITPVSRSSYQPAFS